MKKVEVTAQKALHLSYLVGQAPKSLTFKQGLNLVCESDWAELKKSKAYAKHKAALMAGKVLDLEDPKDAKEKTPPAPEPAPDPVVETGGPVEETQETSDEDAPQTD